nr:MAG TPA: hypothetical protein [Caudoviricetes sp.]
MEEPSNNKKIDREKDFELRERRLKLVYKILYILVAAWAGLFIMFMKTDVKTESDMAAYCFLLTVISLYLVMIIKFIIRELSCLKIGSEVSHEEKEQTELAYKNIWNNLLVVLLTGIVLCFVNVWTWEMFISEKNRVMVRIILSIFLVIGAIIYFLVPHFKDKWKNNKINKQWIQSIFSTIFSYSLFAILIIG